MVGVIGLKKKDTQSQRKIKLGRIQTLLYFAAITQILHNFLFIDTHTQQDGNS